MHRRSSKIFIRRGCETVEFMWADVLKDGSIAMGLLADAIEEVAFAIDAVRGEIRAPDLATERILGRPKITFHSSGKYKLSGRMGLDTATLDRATVEGPPLAELSAPRRMLEVLLPRKLPESRLTPQAADIVVTADSDDELPLRCTISCMAKEEAQRILDRGSNTLFVDTSVWESTGALESASHVWTWTLRASGSDRHVPDRVYMMLLGPVKWGGSQRSS
jgi:hypothetical protein